MKLTATLLLCFGIVAFGNSYGQKVVSTSGKKYTLLEQGTGTWCGACPAGAQKVLQDIAPANPNCIAVAFHNNDGLALASDQFNSTFISGSYIGFPGATIDRSVFTHTYSGGLVTEVCHAPDFWAVDAASQVDHNPPTFDVTLITNYNSINHSINISVKAKSLMGKAYGFWHINAYIVEDSISSSGYPQTSSLNSTPGSWYQGHNNPIDPAYYSHMGVVRKVLASGGIWGDVAFNDSVLNGDSMTLNYSYTIPSTSVDRNISVVGMVQQYDTASFLGPILNCIRSSIGTILKIAASVPEEASAIENIQIAPNPATNYVNVRGSFNSPAATKITITNTIGQLVAEKEYPVSGNLFSEDISLSNFSNGIYFMKISNNGTSVTRRFAVER